MNKNITAPIMVALVVGGASFFGGIKYRDFQLQKQRANFTGQFRNGQLPTNQNGSIERNRFGGGITGEVVSIDNNSLTIKSQDGSTKIVILSDSTKFSDSIESSKNDIKTGTQISIFGTTNSDGSITAQSVQLNPIFRAQPSPAPQN